MGTYPIWAAVPLATFIYLVVDLYSSVKSFLGIILTPSFWLQWLVFSVINIIAWAAIQVAAGDKILPMVGYPLIRDVIIVILSVLATFTIIQSFTLKIGDLKFVDLGGVLESFRKTVQSKIADSIIDISRKDQQKFADRLHAKFNSEPQKLRDEFALVMTFGGRDLSQIGAELNQIEADANTNRISFLKILALRIAKTDLQRAREICR